MAVFLPIHGGSSFEDEYEYDHPIPSSSPTSPLVNTTFLAEGFTEDGRLSRYDNVRAQFPGGDSSALTTYDGFSADHQHPKQSIVILHEDGTTSTQMLPRIAQRDDSCTPAPAPISTNSCFGKVKSWYDRSPLRHFAPFLLLALYAVLGAFVFYWIEHDNERRLLRARDVKMEQLRNDTFLRLNQVAVTAGQSVENRRIGTAELLREYEKKVLKAYEMPETLEWDFLGALFFVGTVFTTIGYGNITPRTSGGRALSIVYAIFGIPLVLAILNQFSKKLTKCLSDLWIRYRQEIQLIKARRLARQKTIRMSSRKAKKHQQWKAKLERDVESGWYVREDSPAAEDEEEEEDKESNAPESRTIPVWVALSLCVGYICSIAAIFLIWETHWSYFDSFYFICISCLTIGLGDIIPDRPHMLILMFVFVILGLSIVSMLLSVIQIKMEEWLYRMMIKMHKEYQKALEKVSDPVERERIMTEMKRNEPWFMKSLAPMIVSQSQVDKIEHMAENLEKVLRVTNNKNIQTENVAVGDAPGQEDVGIGSGASSADTSSITPPMVSAVDTFNLAPIRVEKDDDHLSERARSIAEENMQRKAAGLLCSPDADSISDATSLPMDPINGISVAVDQSVQVDLISICEHSMQTEIAQFQIDELKMKLHAIEEQARSKPILVDVGAGTEVRYFAEQMSQTTNDDEEQRQRHQQMVDSWVETQRQYFAEQTTQTELVTREHQGIQSKPSTENKSVGTERHVFESRSMETEMCQLMNRSMETVDGSLWRGGECSRSVQTMFPAEKDSEAINGDADAEEMVNNADAKRRRFSSTRRAHYSFEDRHLNELGIQCSLEHTGKDVCDVGVQTAVTSMDFDDPALDAFSGLKMAENGGSNMDMLELPDGSNDDFQRDRSSSVIVATENDEAAEYLIRRPKVAKQDLIIQTDDSYLKIARRLNEYRTNKTAPLQIYAAPCRTQSTMSGNDAEPSTSGGAGAEKPRGSTNGGTEKSRSRPRVSILEPTRDQTPPIAAIDRHQRDRDSSGERGGMMTRFLEPAAQKLRESIRRKTAKRSVTKAEGNKPAMDSLEVESPSSSPVRGRNKRLFVTNTGNNAPRRRDSVKSLTPSLVEGRVSEYVAKHERGIHNPGTAKGQRVSRVTIVDLRKQQKSTTDGTNPPPGEDHLESADGGAK